MYSGRMVKKKPQSDVNVTAFEILQAVTSEPTAISLKGRPTKKKDLPAKNPAAVALGRLGGLKGGKARAKSLSAKQRTEFARKAAQSRWEKRSPA
jgi:hypothetical protein